MHYMKKILLMIATCLTLTACGDDIVSIKDNDYSFFGHLEIQALSKKPLSNADIMLSDFRGGDDLKSVTLWINGEKSESKCLSDTAILLNDKKLRPITVKLEKKDEQELSYSAKYSFDEYLEFMAKENKVMISSCGINHILSRDERMGLAEITEAWLKFRDKK